MADFLLDIRINIDESYELFREDIQTLTDRLKPVNIKVQFDAESEKQMQRRIAEIRRSIESLGGSVNSGQGIKSSATEYQQATKAVKEYFAALKALNATKGNDITKENNTYASASGNYAKLAEMLNRVAAAYQNVEQIKERLSAEDRQALTELNTEQENKYAVAVEKRANSERLAADAAAAKNSGLKASESALRSYSSAMIHGETALKNWSAAEKSSNDSSRIAFQNLKSAKLAMENARKSYDGSAESLANLKDRTSEFQSTLKTTEQVLKGNGDATQFWGDRIKKLASKFGNWLSVSQVIMQAVRAVREMIDASIELDDAMTQTQIVTRASAVEMEAFADSAANAAQRTAASISDLVDSATTYARLGSTMDEASELAEFTAMLQNVGDIDVSDAQSAITSIVKAFGLSADEIESVMDKLVTTGNNFPISVSEIAEGMTNASSALSAAGNTFEQSVALLTAANTTIQDASKSSTGLRTIAARIRNTTTELDELGETMTEASYEELVQTLTDCNVALTDMNGEYRSTYDIMSDIAAQWDDMTSMEQAALATALSGTRQQAVFYSLIEQFQEASGAMDAMAHSTGALDDAYAIYLESTTAHIAQFNAAFQNLGADVFQGETLQAFIDAGTAVIKVLDQISDLFNSLPKLAAVAGAVLSLKNFGIAKVTKGIWSDPVTDLIKSWEKSSQGLLLSDQWKTSLQSDIQWLENYQSQLGSAITPNNAQRAAASAYADTLGQCSKAAKAFAADITGSTDCVTSFTRQMAAVEVTAQARNQSLATCHALIQEYNSALTTADGTTANTGLTQVQFASAVSQSNAAMGSYLFSLHGAEAGMAGYTSVLMTSKIATYAMKTAQMALNAALSWGISLLLDAVITGITNYINKEEDASQASIDFAEDIAVEADELYDLTTAYLTLSDAMDAGTAAQEELADAQADVIKALELTGQSVQSLIGDYTSLKEAIFAASAAKLTLNIASSADALNESAEDAIKELTSWGSVLQGVFGSNGIRYTEGIVADGSNSNTLAALLKSLGYDNISYANETLFGIGHDVTFNLPSDSVSMTYGDSDNITYLLEDYAYLKQVLSDITEYGIDTENELYDEIYNRYVTYANVLDPIIESADNLNKIIAEKLILAAQSSGVPESFNEYVQMREALIAQLEENASYSTYGSSSAEGVIDQLLLENDAFSDLAQEYTDIVVAQAEIANQQKAIAKGIALQSGAEADTDAYTQTMETWIALLSALSAEDLNAAYQSFLSGKKLTEDNLQQVIDAWYRAQEDRRTQSEKVKAVLTDAWDTEAFEDTLEDLEELAKSAGGITAEKVTELAEDSEVLAEALETDGMTAQFLAHILQRELDGSDGIDLITEEALELSDALQGLAERFSDVTDAKEAYDSAMSVDEKDTDFKEYAEAYETLTEQIESGTTNSNAFWAAAEFLFGAENLSAWEYSAEAVISAAEGLDAVFSDADSAGAGLLDTLYAMYEAGELVSDTGQQLMEISQSSDGSYAFSLDADHFGEIAAKLNMTEEALLSCFEALSMWGNVSFYDLEEVATALLNIGLASETAGGVAVNLAGFAEQLENLGKTDKEIHDIIVDLSAQDNVTLLELTADIGQLARDLTALGIAAEENGVYRIDYTALGELLSGIGYAKSDAEEMIKALAAADEITLTDATGEAANLASVFTYLSTLDFSDVTASVEAVADAISSAAETQSAAEESPIAVALGNVDDTSTEQVVSSVEAIGSAAESAASKIYGIQDALEDISEQTYTIYYDVKQKSLLTNMLGFANGTKNAPNGAAVVGEDGAELHISDGNAQIVGQSGPEIVHLQAGDRIYTAQQTKKILGKSGRYLHGSMPAYSTGLNNAQKLFSQTAMTELGGSNNTYTWNYNGNISAVLPSISVADTNGSESEDDDKEIIDWIEIAIERVERVINNLATVAKSAFHTLTEKLTATGDEIDQMTSELVLQQSAYARYMQEANAVGLSADLTAKVQRGDINISEYDSDTADLIEDYQKWYEKALDCSDAILELSESIAELYQNKFDDITTDYENQLSALEHLTTTYNNQISDIEKRGYWVSTEYYRALQAVTQQNLAVQQQALDDLTAALESAMQSGTVAQYSESWYEMRQQIDSVTEAIQESEIAFTEYTNAIRDLEWERFDYLLEQIGYIIEEADFLIDLMESSKLYTENGQLTDTGTATMGLHAQNYNIYMAQADKYAQELLSLNQEIADDPNNTTLLERREELLEAQREAILTAEDEKQAIIDMVEDGIELELDALQELIDTYTDSLDAAKDLYDYQKKVKDQTSEIASLQKQIAAYAGDDSEETKATVQKLQVSLSDAMEELEETQYDNYISAQKKLLDDLYTEYESILNQRLDDVDALIADMIDMVNQSADTISHTISSESEAVGYTLSNEMRSIWANSGSAYDIVTGYGESFLTQLTTIQTVLSAIGTNVAAMATENDAQVSVATSSSSTSGNSASSGSGTSVPASSGYAGGSAFNEDVKQGVATAIWIYGSDGSGWGSGSTRKERLSAKFGTDNANAIQSYIDTHGVNGDIYKSWVQSGKGSLDQYYYSAFRSGGLADYTGFAWLDGTPTEPEMVLSAKDTANFIALKDAMNRVASGDSPLSALFGAEGASAQILSSVSQARTPVTTQPATFGDITYHVNIPIDHVQDYEDFMNQMRKDDKFEKLIQSMTVDRMAGGSRIAKNQYSW